MFTQQISYDKRQDGSNGYLNGNVSELFHRFDDKTDTDWRGQNFTYDHLNRFKGNSNVLANNGTFRVWNNTETLNYDPNGNILGLIRNKEGVGNIDALNYIYRNGGNSNILATIGDNASPTLGFKARGTNAYSFDANGNLLTDANKGISTPITYNYLDLPTQVTVPDENGTNRTLNYTYDATGQKLAMLVNGTTDRTFYTGEIEYNNNALPTRIHTPMGYISRDADDLWQYTYNLKDFQGSVRVTAKYDPETKLAVTTQKTDFYVLGLPLRYDTENFNRYLYQDKEQQPYSEFFDFGWRQYDPLVGRWFNNDPADQFSSISPYAFVRKNPLMYVDPDGAFSFPYNKILDVITCNIPNFVVKNSAYFITNAAGAVGRAAQDGFSNGNIDPLAHKMPFASPYAYCWNNPVLRSDPDGDYPDLGELLQRARTYVANKVTQADSNFAQATVKAFKQGARDLANNTEIAVYGKAGVSVTSGAGGAAQVKGLGVDARYRHVELLSGGVELDSKKGGSANGNYAGKNGNQKEVSAVSAGLVLEGGYTKEKTTNNNGNITTKSEIDAGVVFTELFQRHLEHFLLVQALNYQENHHQQETLTKHE